MRVLSVAYSLLPAGPDAGGGAEQILSLVERGLMRAGHQSIVIAVAGSDVEGTWIETPGASGEITEEVRERAQQEHLKAIGRALRTYDVDLVHFHGLDFHAYVPNADVPMLATLHLPVAWYSADVWDQARVKMNCVSKAQAKSDARSEGLPVVLNGIDTGRYRKHEERGDYLMFLGRICPEKGVTTGLRVAHRLGLPMVVAGPVHPFESHQAYFAEQIRPLLDERRTYAGELSVTQKAELLAGAKCVLIPSSVAETSSLVAMEAIASGTPVIAFRSGALPEVVDHGETGFIVDSEDEMAAAVHQVGSISPDVCRARAQERFDASRMVSDYLALYDCLLG